MIHHLSFSGGSDEESPLHIAAQSPRGAVITDLLIKSGASHSLQSSHGKTALHFAAAAGSLKVVQILLAENANPLTMDSRGDNSLHTAVRHCHHQVVEELLKHIGENDPTATSTAINLQNEVRKSASFSGDLRILRETFFSSIVSESVCEFARSPVPSLRASLAATGIVRYILGSAYQYFRS